jgi:hypothetical protein
MKGPEFNICDHYNTHFNNLAEYEGSLILYNSYLLQKLLQDEGQHRLQEGHRGRASHVSGQTLENQFELVHGDLEGAERSQNSGRDLALEGRVVEGDRRQREEERGDAGSAFVACKFYLKEH